METKFNSNKFPSFKKSRLLPTHISVLAMWAIGAVGPAYGQDSDDEEVQVEEVHVTGLKSSIRTAQQIKRDAESVLDSIVAEDIGKLPDRSVTDALQRLPGISVSRFDDPGDPEHFAGEGAGVSIRGLPQVRAELNGGDIFSADGGRGLSFDDVPAELMAGVDVHKSPTADRVEGGLGGIVNLRTRMPFDSEGQTVSFTVKSNYGDIIEENNFEFSGLYSAQWENDGGKFGFLVDFSKSEISSRSDNILTRAYHPRDPGGEGDRAEIEADRTVWIPRGADWRRNDYTRERDGKYLALQYAPNDSAEFYFTAFRSEAKREWLENAFFIDAGGGFDSFLPVKGADDWVYDENNALVSGTITTAQGNGVPFGTSTRNSANDSVTSDYSFGFEWKVRENLILSGNYQNVDSTAKGTDYTLGLIAYPESITVGNLNTMNGTPSIEVEAGFLEEFTNYSYGQMMSIPKNNKADSTAARLDLEYLFEDSLIESIKVGARFTEKSADNRESNNWAARYQPWMVGNSWQPFASTDEIPRIDSYRYIERFSFDAFQRGETNVPSSAWLFNPELLNDFPSVTDAVVATTPGGAGAPDFDALNLGAVNNMNNQEEDTEAVYIRLDFGFPELKMPVYGNIGVRHVKTSNVAHGQLSYPTFSLPTGDVDDEGNDITVQPFFQPDTVLDAENSYSNTLPSFNLRMEARDDLIFRVSASDAIWRPEFWRMKALLSVSASIREDVTQPDTIDDLTPEMLRFNLDSGGTNPYLEPMKARQYDLTAEWYFDDDGGMVYAGLFKKNVEDFFRTSTTTLDEIGEFTSVTSELTINTGEADIQGFELGATYFFESLPSPFDGFGIQGNYTYIDSDSKVPPDSAPIDTDGSTYDDLPLDLLSEETRNLVLMYEKYGFYARLAYNWRSEQLLSVNANGWKGNNGGVDWRLPVYADDYGQLDFSMGYDLTDNISLAFDAYNISESETRGIVKQNGAGEHTAFVNTQDTRYSLSLRATF